MYEVFPDNAGKFEEFMFDLEKIYSIDKLIIRGYGNQLQGDLVDIEMADGEYFRGNIKTQGKLINKIERDLAANFIANNDTDHVLQNYQKISAYLTTPQLKQDFLNTINMLQNNQTIEQSSEVRR